MKSLLFLIEPVDNDVGECGPRGSERGHPARYGEGGPLVLLLLYYACRSLRVLP